MLPLRVPPSLPAPSLPCCTPQVTAAMRLADGVLLVVDVLEGVGAATERAIQQAVAEGLAITLLISKVRVLCVCRGVVCARARARACVFLRVFACVVFQACARTTDTCVCVWHPSVDSQC